MTLITRSRIGKKITFSIPTNRYLKVFIRNPAITPELTLKKSDGSELKFIADGSGAFRLGKLEDENYTFEIIGKQTGGTRPERIKGHIQVSENGKTVIAIEDSTATGTISSSSSETTTTASIEGVSSGTEIDNGEGAIFREIEARMDALNYRWGHMEEMKKELIEILEDPATEGNLSWRITTLQKKFQALKAELELEIEAIEVLTTHHHKPEIERIIENLEDSELYDEAKNKFLDLINRVKEQAKSAHASVSREATDIAQEIEDTYAKYLEAIEKRHTLIEDTKNLAKDFDRRTLRKNQRSLVSIAESKSKIKKNLSQNIIKLSSNPKVAQVNTIQIEIKTKIGDNDKYIAEGELIRVFADEMKTTETNLNNMINEIKELDKEIADETEMLLQIFTEFWNHAASKSGEL